jgi:hypothetical protein
MVFQGPCAIESSKQADGDKSFQGEDVRILLEV